jgi:hypothetical protein
MSGFLSHRAARGMGQAGSVHSAARLPYASPPALVEAGGEAMALPPSLPSLPLGDLPQEHVLGQVPRPEAVPVGTATAVPSPPSPCCKALILAPHRRCRLRLIANPRSNGRSTAPAPGGSVICGSRSDRACCGARAGEGRQRMTRIGLRRSSRPLPRSGDKRHPLFKGALSAQGTAWRTPVEETTEVHVSIGRIEVTAVHETPQPKRAPARNQRALSLEEYLARRKAGRP